MSCVVVATYVTKHGEADTVAALEAIVPLAQVEPACIGYRSHASVEDPSVFL